MTLKAWLKLNRQPSYLGINARSMLKAAGKSASVRKGYRFQMLHTAVNMRTPDLKHQVWLFGTGNRLLRGEV